MLLCQSAIMSQPQSDRNASIIRINHQSDKDIGSKQKRWRAPSVVFEAPFDPGRVVGSLATDGGIRDEAIKLLQFVKEEVSRKKLRVSLSFHLSGAIFKAQC